MAIAIGDAISGSTPNTILYVDANTKLANAATLTFDGTTFTVASPMASTSTVGFFGATPVGNPYPTGSNALVAGPAYTQNEQRMLQDLWTMLKNLGVLN